MDPAATTILLTCLNYTSAAAKSGQFTHISAEEWRQVAELAGEQKVAPLLYHRLKGMNLALPGEVLGILKQDHLQNAVRNLRLYHQLNKLLQQLHVSGIPVIVLKGAYLAEAVYADIAFRTMRDIDLLVKETDLPRVEQVLLTLGCTPADAYNRVVSPDDHHFRYKTPGLGFLVEIHWTITDSFHRFQINLEELWNRAQPVSVALAPALTLAPEDLLLHLCIHAAGHLIELRLRMLSDLGEFLQRRGADLDWEAISLRAREWDALHAVYLLLRLAQELLGVAVPAGWLASLRPEDFREDYLALAREQILLDSSDLIGKQDQARDLMHLVKLWGPTSLKDKLALVHGFLWPARETIAHTYPVPADSWRVYFYYFVRFKDMLVKSVQALWWSARGNPKSQAIAARMNQVTELRDWLMSS